MVLCLQAWGQGRFLVCAGCVGVWKPKCVRGERIHGHGTAKPVGPQRMDRAGTGFSRYGSECLFRLPILQYLLSVNEHSLEHEEEGFCQTDFDKFVEGDNLLPLDSRELLIAPFVWASLLFVFLYHTV